VRNDFNDGSRRRQGWIGQRIDPVREFFSKDVWSIELVGLPTFRKALYKLTRVLFLAVRGVVENRCLFRASALTYVTVLSLVPLLAFAFSVAKGLGAYDTLVGQTILPFLDETFGELPAAEASSAEASSGAAAHDLRQGIDQVLSFVETTDVGSLGFFGLAFLLYTVVKLLSSIEQSFNEIWGVQQSRSLVRKLSDYLSIVIIVPIFLVTATGITTAAQSGTVHEILAEKLGLGPVIEFAMRFSSLVAMWAGFTFIFLFMPNTRVRIRSALIGGVVGGTLWHIAQILHVKFQVGMANYNAIYSGFAAIPIFMIWIFVSWVTVLLGAEFAYAHQNEPAYRQIARARQHNHAFKELLALRALARIAANFLAGRSALKISGIATTLGVPERSLEQIFATLRDAKILAMSEDKATGELTILPERDLGSVRIKDVLDALKGRDGPIDFPVQDALDERTDRFFHEYDEQQRNSALNRTLHDIGRACLEVEADQAAAPATSPVESPA